MPDARLIEACREKIRNGLLPASSDARTYGGPSSGTDCAACEQPIDDGAIELQIEWGGDGTATEEARVHAVCFAAWAEAVRRLDADGT